MADYKPLAEAVISAVGGKENVTNVTHCMTRLRFNVKDDSQVDVDTIKSTKGVIGYVHSGGQHQLIIGQTVDMVYETVCAVGGFSAQAAIDENLDRPKEKLTPKAIGNNILNYLAGSLTPLIPLIIAAAMFRTVQSILGPTMLGVISEDSDLYVLLGMVYNAGFYFMPIYVGMTAAAKLGISNVMGMLMGGILIAPELIEMATNGATFSVYGIPAMVSNYSQTILPIILSVWVMSYVERFFNKHVPATLRTIFAPFLTMVVMVPVALCVLGPAGNIIGAGISSALLAIGGVGGFVAVALIAALWEFLVMSGMHLVLAVTMMTVIMSQGYEGIVSPAATCATIACMGMAFGAFLRIKDKEEKALNFGYFVSAILGGVTEPALYGLAIKYKRPFIGLAIGGALGGLYAGITGVNVYVMGSTNILMAIGFAGGGTANLINGLISLVISFVAATVLTYLFGFDKDEPVVKGVAVAEDTEVKEFAAPVSGEAISYKDIKDEAFASGMLGEGVGIIPEDNVIKSPCAAEVTSVIEASKHAVGLKLANGAEILIHEGLDTVGMNGEGFKLFVKEGDKVKAGEKLISFDAELIRSKGLDPMTVVLLTNSGDFPGMRISTGSVKVGTDAVITF